MCNTKIGVVGCETPCKIKKLHKMSISSSAKNVNIHSLICICTIQSHHSRACRELASSAHLKCPHICRGSPARTVSSCRCSWGCWTSELIHIFSSLQPEEGWCFKLLLFFSTRPHDNLTVEGQLGPLTIFAVGGVGVAVSAAAALWRQRVSLAQLTLKVHNSFFF